MIYLYFYLVFALLVGALYVYLYHVYYMPQTVKNATRGEKARVYIMLYVSMFALAPYALFEIIKTKLNGGFNK